ncbi:MAG TPA: response regulator [Polyangia bacterium]
MQFPTQPASGGPLILIVDDDLDHRMACRDLLEENGYVVQERGDGQKALARLLDTSEAKPALVLLDLSMPLMDGWQLLTVMKRHARLHQIPVVLISADEPKLDPEKHAPVSAYLRKPINSHRLLALTATYAR